MSPHHRTGRGPSHTADLTAELAAELAILDAADDQGADAHPDRKHAHAATPPAMAESEAGGKTPESVSPLRHVDGPQRRAGRLTIAVDIDVRCLHRPRLHLAAGQLSAQCGPLAIAALYG